IQSFHLLRQFWKPWESIYTLPHAQNENALPKSVNSPPSSKSRILGGEIRKFESYLGDKECNCRSCSFAKSASASSAPRSAIAYPIGCPTYNLGCRGSFRRNRPSPRRQPIRIVRTTR